MHLWSVRSFPSDPQRRFRFGVLALCLAAAMAWFLSSGCASYTPDYGNMRTNAPTVPPLVGAEGGGQGGIVATGGVRLQQTLVEHIAEHSTPISKEGVWSTSPLGGWAQLEALDKDGAGRLVAGGEYGAGWSAWGGAGGLYSKVGSQVVVGPSALLGLTRRQTLYWGDSVVRYRVLPTDRDSVVPGYRRSLEGVHLWMRLGLTFQRRERGPWGEIGWVPLYSWGGQNMDGYFSTMGSLALGWHEPIGAQDRVVVGWRGIGTGYTMSNQGMLLWQHMFSWKEPKAVR